MPRKKNAPRAGQRYWIGYCRKSTDTEDKQIHTLQDQAVMIQQHYDRLPPSERQVHPLRIVQEARSAYHPGRPLFDHMMRMADHGEVHGVIVVHPNRISRNHGDSGAFSQRLVDRRIGCLDTTTGKRYTASDSNDIFMLTLEGAMSWKDSRDKGDRVLQAMRMRANEGHHMGPVRIGYQTVFRPDGKSVLEVVPDSAGKIRRLYNLAAAGTYSVQDLTGEAGKMNLVSRKGNRLGKSGVHAILRDPIYKGYVRFDGILAKGVHEPIVAGKVWDRVQAALAARFTQAARPKDLTLRELFFFGTLLKCPKCGRCLYPYRAKRRYIYYECKNSDSHCGVTVPQTLLLEQLPQLLNGIRLGGDELDQLRDRLLHEHQRRSGDDVGLRKSLNAQYEQTVREIGDVFSQRKQAELMGVLAEVDQRLEELRRRRDELLAQLNACHEKGTAWIERVIRSFELIELLQEAIFHGPMRSREAALKAIASNFSVDGRKLVWEPRSPFREVVREGGRPKWLPGLYDVRTEIAETCDGLEACLSLFHAA